MTARRRRRRRRSGAGVVLAENLRWLVASRVGGSVKAAARELGLPYTIVWRLAGGEPRPEGVRLINPEYLVRIAAGFGVTVDALLTTDLSAVDPNPENDGAAAR